jgi:hypothetical protein
VRIELRQLASQGISLPGGARHAVDAHGLSQRYVIVRIPLDGSEAAVMYGPDGMPRRAVGEDAFTPVFRDAFYRERSKERQQIDEYVEGRMPAVPTKRSTEPAVPTSVAPHPQSAQSPLDSLRPLDSDGGWPFDVLRDTAAGQTPPAPTKESPPDASSLRQPQRQHDRDPVARERSD